MSVLKPVEKLIFDQLFLYSQNFPEFFEANFVLSHAMDFFANYLQIIEFPPIQI